MPWGVVAAAFGLIAWEALIVWAARDRLRQPARVAARASAPGRIIDIRPFRPSAPSRSRSETRWMAIYEYEADGSIHQGHVPSHRPNAARNTYWVGKDVTVYYDPSHDPERGVLSIPDARTAWLSAIGVLLVGQALPALILLAALSRR